MAIKTGAPPEEKLARLWHQACTDYAKETGLSLDDEGFPKVGGPEDLSRQLDNEKDSFEDFRMKKRPLLHAMQMVVAPFESWGDIIAGVAAAAFPPASAIMGAMLLLIRGARRVSDAFDMITDLFHKLGNFALRLDSYKGVPLSEGMKTIIVKVLVNYLRVCAASQHILTKGSLKSRLSKWAKNMLVEDDSVSSLLAELEELTSQEHLMVSAHGLKLTHQAVRNTEELLEREKSKSDRERLERVKAALNPISSSGQVFSSISENRIPGSGRWIEGRISSWWQGSQPLLWLHGGPGVGKSHLASKIIGDLAQLETTVTVGSFFFKNNDVDLRSLNNALRTLAWHIATENDGFAIHAEEFSLREDPENSYVVWRKLFLDYFTSASNRSTCLVIDAIDEADPEQQDLLFSLLEKAFQEDHDIVASPPLRIVLISRDSVRGLIEEHSLAWIPEIEVGNEQNKDDLNGYVTEKLKKSKLFRGSADFREEIVTAISQEAEGLWEWANLVIKSVLRCRTTAQIRKVIKTVPRGIGAMLNQELQRLSRELTAAEGTSDDGESPDQMEAPGIEQLKVLLSLVTLAQKPLTISQLDLMIEIILEEEVLNLEDDIRTVYSSLFASRSKSDEYPVDDTDIVTLRHSSFYEFFRATQDTGRIFVDVSRAETSFISVFLYVMQEESTPGSSRDLRSLWYYASQFLPTYLANAKPESATEEHRTEISSRLEKLFTEEQNMKWFVTSEQVQEVDQYAFYPTARLADPGKYYLDVDGTDLVNERANQVLDWLLPETRTALEEFALSSEVASNACSFTVLFSKMIVLWRRLWLDPGQINETDGLSGELPALLIAYHKLAKRSPEFDNDECLVRHPYRFPSRVLRAAELQDLPQNCMWHARVAQSLFLYRCFRKALEHFETTLILNKEDQTLNEESLRVIHRDMARTLTELGKHNEALEYYQLFQPPQLDIEDCEEVHAQDRIIALLSAAKMKHLAKLTEDAIATANKAWELVLRQTDELWGPDLFSFFEIFLELHQPRRLRPVWESAHTRCRKRYERWGTSTEDFPEFLAHSLYFRPRIMYRVFHYALGQDDHHYLDILAGLLDNLENANPGWGDPAVPRYLLATALYSKRKVAFGIAGWLKAILTSDPDESSNATTCRALSLSHLATFCLSNADIPLSTLQPVILNQDSQSADICLVISRWLRDEGDMVHARDALRGRMKQCIALLSDDDPSNDSDAFISLLQTFLLTSDNDEDLTAIVYLLKLDDERLMRAYHKDEYDSNSLKDDDEAQPEQSPNQASPVDPKDPGEEDLSDVEALFNTIPMTECASCKREMWSIHRWYFCRSCPLKGICPRCYDNSEQDDTGQTQTHGIPTITGVCPPEHEYFYTGSFIQASERVPEGMVPLVSTSGERKIVWIEEWKDDLAKKWETEDFEFQGGLHAWCMRVLPEPQKSRWATFFSQ